MASFVFRSSLLRITLGLGASALLAGCASDKSHSEEARPSVKPVEGVSAVARPEGPYNQLPPPVGSVDPQPIDLTEDDAVGWGSAHAEIIDTRLIHPQIQLQPPLEGPPKRPGMFLPPHPKPPRGAEAGQNDLLAGEVSDQELVTPGPLFPGISQTPWTPPDPTIAVGPDHIVTTVNMRLAFYQKDGTLLFAQNLDSTGDPGFFETIGGGNFTFDPKCFYDHYAQRFVIVVLEQYGSTQSWIDIAVSDDSDPTGIWYKYRTNSVVTVGSNTYWVDYPGAGYDQDAYYVTGNLFGLNNSGFGGVLFRSFNKTPLLTGAPAVFADVRDGNGASVQAAQHFGSAPIAPFFVSVNSTTQIKVQAVRNPLTSPQLSTTNVTVPSFNYPSGGAPNLGGGSIDNLDGRIMNVHWRNGRLYACHAVRLNSKNQARWYQFATNNWPTSGSVTLTQSGNINGGSSGANAVHTFFPAIYSNWRNDVGVVLGASSADKHASVHYTGRKTTDPNGTMAALTQMTIGSAGATGRWGDYFDIAIDPVDDFTFWAIGEYANAGGWATWIGSFTIGCLGDLDNDGEVGQSDLAILLAAYGLGNGGDLNGDGQTDQADLALLLAKYGSSCP